MAKVKDTLILEDKMSQTINNITKAFEKSTTATDKAKMSMDAISKKFGESSAQAEKATLRYNRLAEAQKRIHKNMVANASAKTGFAALAQAEKTIADRADEAARKTSFLSSVFKDFKNKIGSSLPATISIGAALGNIGANIAMSALNGLKNSIGEAINTASDLVEVQNVVDVAFGNSADEINQWSKTALTQYGLNELSAKQFAGTMGAMLKSSGLTGDSVVEMSKGIASLAGDMASFYNLNPEEAFMKLRSGISGETEPLKQLGINMSVANLEAFALSQGIKESYSKMSQAAQMTLRYQYLMQATADAQGDFSRTSDTFANQQKLLSENWKQLTASLATGLLPILAKFMELGNKIIDIVIAMANIFNTYLKPAFITVTALILAVHIPALIALTKQYGLVAAKAIWAGVQMAGAWLIGLGPVGWVIAAIGAVVAVFTVLINKNAKVAESFYKIVNAIDLAVTKFRQWKNRKDDAMVQKLEDDYQARVAQRADRVANIGKEKNEATKPTKIEDALKKALGTGTGIDKFGEGGALKTKQQGAIELKEEDLKMLNELATRDFMVRYQALSPSVNFNGDMNISNNVDIMDLVGEFHNGVQEAVDNGLKTGTGE